MNLTKRKFTLIWIAIIFTLALAVAGYFLISGDHTNIEYNERHVSFDQGWSLTTYTYTGSGESLISQTTENVVLPTKITIHGKETAVFKNTLPDEIPESMAIISRNFHLMLKVKVDGEEVFSFPSSDWNGFGNLVSDEWCLIDMKPEYAGKPIEISFYNTSERLFKFSNYVGEFYYGTRNSLVHFIRSRGFTGMVLGNIVTVIGALLLIVSLIYKGHTKQSTNTAMGMAFFCFGIWMINRDKMSVFPNHATYVYWLSLMCLMLVAPFVFLYSYYRNNTFKSIALFGFRYCLICDPLIVLSCFFIDYSVEYITPFAYILSILAMLLTSYSLFKNGWGKESKRQSKNDRLLDRAEFFSSLIFPTLGILESIFSSDKLWTEWSNFFMFGMTAYSLIYFGFVLWRTFLVVQDRTNVTKQLHNSQLELMMGQIQPHFMFNTLSSIRTLIKVDPDVAYDMVYNFSNYLRANVDNLTNPDGIKFESEVKHIQSYVEIEKVRYGDRLAVEYDIQESDFLVPPLSIQPLVENAIKHGVSKKVGGGTVWLTSYELVGFNVVEVNDDGLGFNAESASRVFGPYVDATISGVASEDMNQINISLIRTVMEALDLKDADGNPIVIKKPDKSQLTDLTGNGSDRHKSSGMMNILLRLREMADAKIEISSQEGSGSHIRVFFPKK